MVTLAPDIDPRHAELIKQRQMERIKEFGKLLAGIAGFVWAIKVLLGQR